MIRHSTHNNHNKYSNSKKASGTRPSSSSSSSWLTRRKKKGTLSPPGIPGVVWSSKWMFGFIFPLLLSSVALMTIVSFLWTLEKDENASNLQKKNPPNRPQVDHHPHRNHHQHRSRSSSSGLLKESGTTSNSNNNNNNINNNLGRIRNEKESDFFDGEELVLPKNPHPEDAATRAVPEVPDDQPQEKSLFVPTSTDSTTTTTTTNHTLTIAYAISLIKCGDFQSSTNGLQDAALVLQHSIYLTHMQSKYQYQTYALVHTQAAPCATILQQAGYTVLISDPPISKDEIQNQYLQKHIHKEWCCGAAEFIKLKAYELTHHPLVVHVDIDFVFHQPMDDVFDAMLLSSSSKNHSHTAVTSTHPNIPLERSPLHNRTSHAWPSQHSASHHNIQALMTRDWGQVMPGRKPLFQAGFLIIKPNRTILEEILNVIRHDDYVEGFSRSNGWGGAGYGGLVGAMAMQGLLAYFYDIYYPDAWLELNQCRFNHMGMDIKYRSQPSFRPHHAKVGQCRNDMGHDCEDCMITPLSQIYNIHYTQCRKPWNCIGEGDRTVHEKTSIPEDSVNLDHCMELLTVWHSVRTDLERRLMEFSGDTSIPQGQLGTYKRDVFQGHCTGNGQAHYLPLTANNATKQFIYKMYQ